MDVSNIWCCWIIGNLDLLFASNQSIFVRAIVYTLFILAWEYISGFAIRLLIGYAPWDYKGEYPDHSLNPKKNLHGLICLEFVPIWYVVSILAELLYLFLKAHFVL
jgi:hypothetical protein